MGNGGATLKKRDLIVTLLYFLDMAVLILSVMFSIWMRNEFRVEALAKEITRGSFWLSVVVLAVYMPACSRCRGPIRCSGSMPPCATRA